MSILNEPSSPTVSVGIIGMGAIGCLISSQLPLSCQRFALIQGEQDFFHFAIESDSQTQQFALPAWNDQVLDMVLVCVKAAQTLAALKQWQSAISKETQIVIVQNGFGQHDQVKQLFPNNTLFAVSTTEGANRINRHHIHHAGRGITQWGYFSGPKKPLLLALDKLSGDHQNSSNIRQVLLDKLAINAAINALTVKYNCRNGDLLSQDKALQDLQSVCTEVESCYQTLNWPLSFSLFERAKQVALTTANNVSSMLQDVRNQNETEIDYINGYLVTQAKAVNLTLTTNQQLVDLIKQQVR